MAPVFKSARTAVVKLVGGGTTINLSSGLTDSSFDRSVDASEVTTYGDAARVYVPALADSNMTLSGWFASTYESLLASTKFWQAATNPTLHWSPHSTANGNIHLRAPVVVTGISCGAPVGDTVTFELSLQGAGAVNSSAHA